MKFLQKYKIWKSILILYIFLILLGLAGCKSTKHCAQHQMNYEKISPTCQTPGYERYYCSKCKYEEIKNQVSPVNHKYSSYLVEKKYCTALYREKCDWCGIIGKFYGADNHQFESKKDEFNDIYLECKKCNYKYNYKNYIKVNLIIEAPTPIDYYKKIKIRYESNVSNLYVKFSDITPTEYFLQDIVFIFKDKEIHYREESYAFEFNGCSRDWFERSEGESAFYNRRGLNLKDIHSYTGFNLLWSAEYPNIYDVITIKFIFVE